MRYFFVIISFVGLLSFSQKNEVNSVTYILNFKPYKNLPETKEYVRTYRCKNKSIYKSYNGFFRDTILADPNHKEKALSKYFTFLNHTIIIKNDVAYFNNFVGNDEYNYTENLDHNWVMSDEVKKIKGYSCKKATLNYGGRTWETWYTPDLPIDMGPYKFNGLPGLIMSMKDDSGTYDFEFYSFKKRDYFGSDFDCEFKQLFHLKPIDQRIETTRVDYNKLEFQYSSMTLSEAMDYLNPRNTGSLYIRVDGEESKIKDERRDIPNPIEIDHLD
jgi:GLPGLI family protein